MNFVRGLFNNSGSLPVFISLRRFDVGPDADQPPDDKLPDGAAGSQSPDLSQQSSQFRSHPHTRLAL